MDHSVDSLSTSAKPIYGVRLGLFPVMMMMGIAFANACFLSQVAAQEPQWIWASDYPVGRVPLGSVYFRKTIQLSSVEQARVTIVADDAYDLYVNGRAIGSGNSIHNLDQFDLTRYLAKGRNVVAVKAENRTGPTAALVVELQIKQPNQDWQTVGSDATWKTSIEASNGWHTLSYNDASWKAARPQGKITSPTAAPVGGKESPQQLAKGRFVVPSGFRVDQIFDDESVGSVIAMAFNEFGHIIASQEGGPLYLLFDSDKDGKHDKSRVYCDALTNVQGILPLNGDVYVTGDGPEGNGLYKLSDEDRNGTLEKTSKLFGFEGVTGEHGAHQISLGPDGMIYVVLGNHVKVDAPVDLKSPYRQPYEGDLLQPRFEDPGGHARGIKAPGGTIIRTNLAGDNVQLIAGGIRNAYDFAIHPNGSIFLHDSDMEADVGTTWYRPTSLFDIVSGAELGWRSGWAQWPEYYPDRIPTMLETGRGSPTGAVVYDHFYYPARYHSNVFLADWSEGRILSVQLKPDGASYQGQAEVFVRGTPMNVTDLDVSPDGSLYFCTGGRGTDGGIYRVLWTGEVASELKDLGTGISRAIRQPQLNSAWARQEVAMQKKELGDTWEELVAGVAYSPDNPARYRVKALDLMQLLGPIPTTDLLIDLSRSPNEAVRAKTAQLLGLKNADELAVERLGEMLNDTNRLVQRHACEALVRCGGKCDPKALQKALASEDRSLAFSARRLLETLDPEDWRERWIKPLAKTGSEEDVRLLVQASLALMIASPNVENGKTTLQSLTSALEGFVSDRDFLDLLRVLTVTIHRGQFSQQDLAGLRARVAGEFPAGEPILNRELIRLAIYLQSPELAKSSVEYLGSDAPMAERVHVAMHLPFLKQNWETDDLFKIMKFLEDATKAEGGSSYPLYIMNATADLGKGMSLEDARTFVKEGVRWPNTALAALRKFPERISPDDFDALKAVDQAIDQSGLEADYYKRLKTGITAILSRSGDADSMAYLREVWRRSPDRRASIAFGLSLNPDGENWDYLIRSLPILDTYAVPDVLQQLIKVPAAPDDAEAIRQVILHGLRMQQASENAAPALSLLGHWTGQSFVAGNPTPEEQIKSWQNWFHETYPQHVEANLPTKEENSIWSLELVNEFLDGEKSKSGSIEQGKLAWTKAKCADCHRNAGKGGVLGPDLTGLAKRFTRQETLEAVLYPSHVISDQFATQRVLTTDGGVEMGIVSQLPNGKVKVVRSDLSEVVIAKDDVDVISPSKVSFMPTGLFETLSGEEIRDLMAYLGYIPGESMADSKPAKTTR